MTYYDMPGPGTCILVRNEDASLWLWEHCRMDGSNTSWPIWHGQVTRQKSRMLNGALRELTALGKAS